MAATEVKTVCPYCGVGCGMVLSVEDGQVVKVKGDKSHPTNFGRLCTKGSSANLPLRDSGRMEQAYVRAERGQQPTALAMDAAISETAQRLRRLLDEEGPEALAFYVSGQMSYEAQYLINKLAKGFVGCNQIESNSRLCMSSASSGYKLSLGADGPPGSYQDLDKADAFLVIGANMADCHPILFLRLMDRVKSGAKLIVVDPRRNATADKADLFLQIKAGTDLALLNGLLYLLLQNGATDADFIAAFTEGWESLPAFLDDYTPDKVAAITGLAEADIRQAASWLGEADAFTSCWTMGLNQSTHGTWNTNALCNLHLATGQICRPGAGPFSLTGQPNAMGGREMGYMGPGLPGQRSLLVDEDRAFIERLWGLEAGSISQQVGAGTVDLFEQLAAGNIKACWIICTNPVATLPNRQKAIEALEKAELVIAQDAFLDTETNRYADILLPAALWAEREGVMVNSERNMTLMRQAIPPPGEALPDWQIIARVASEMGFAEAFDYQDSADIFEEIKLAANPRSGYDLRGASHQRLRQTPLQWPCASEDGDDRNPIRYRNDGVSQTLRQAEDGSRPSLAFPTESGRARFYARPHIDPAEIPDDDYPMVFNSGRLQHQWHTLTKTGKVAKLNKLNPGPFVEVHPEDAAALGISDGTRVEIRSRRGHACLPAVVSDRVMVGNCFAPFHWNDVFGDELAVNALTNDAVDPLSLQPEFKYCAVSLTAMATEDSSADEAAAGEETDMGIDMLGRLLALEDVQPPPLNEEERRYLGAFVTGLRHAGTPTSLPLLPANAPLTLASRQWVEGLLAGFFSRAATTAVTTDATLPAAQGAVAALEPALQESASQATRVRLLWASQTGNAEELAERYADKLKGAGCEVQLESMDDFQRDSLNLDDRLLLISSTFGDGDPPDNGHGLWDYLSATDAPKLDGLRYGVLALGDSSYDQFCGHGKRLDSRLGELGAEPLLARADCDSDFEETADEWMEQFIAGLSDAQEAAGDVLEEAPPEAAPAAEPKVEKVDKASKGLPGSSKKHPYHAPLLLNQRLNSRGATKDTRQIAFDISESGLSYEAGDALGVWARNCPSLVDEVIRLAELDGDAAVMVKGQGELPLSQALSEHVEIARPSQAMLEALAAQHDDLKSLLSNSEQLKKWLWGKQLADLLYQYPLKLTADELLGMLRPLQPRQYSISSSPLAHAGSVEVTLSVVRYSNDRRQRKGVASSFLAERVAEGEAVPIFIQKAPHFSLPQDGSRAVIMVGPGTGVAPFRGFLHERRARGDSGRNWLFFGEQHQASDFYYRDELEAFHKEGLLTHLDLAFSRDQSKKVYVQQRMREQGEILWQWLEDGACFYVCGDASRMARDVEEALKDIISQHGGKNALEAQEYLKEMKWDKRYLRDVY